MTSGIHFKKVSFQFNQEYEVLKNISLTIRAGTFVGIIGTNGSGKSTLTYLCNGLIPHVIKGKLRGDVLIDNINTKDKKVAFFANKIGMLFQNPDFSLFNLTVKEEIEFGLKNLKLSHRTERVSKALEIVGMSNYESRNPQTLSLGEKQKICLASVLALDTEYLILDEPIAMLDYQSSIEIYTILSKLHQSGKTIIVIEHDTEFLWRFAEEIIILEKGQLLAHDHKNKILTDAKLLTNLRLKPVNYE